jgi:molecular chaperone GrpE
MAEDPRTAGADDPEMAEDAAEATPDRTEAEADLPDPPPPHHLEEGWEPTDSVPAVKAAEALQEADDRFLRLAAEFDNYRKRTTREKTASFDRGASDLVGRLLDELDDVDRLLASDPATTDYAAFRDGFVLFSRKLAKELGGAGLERIDPVGKKFDPNEHEAVAILTPDDPAKDDLVAATFQVGYRFRGNVIRHAKVQVWTVDGQL